MQLTALNTGTEFRVHEAHCPVARHADYPDIREKVHLSAVDRDEAVQRIWAGSLAEPHPRPSDAEAAERTVFLPCCRSLAAKRGMS